MDLLIKFLATYLLIIIILLAVFIMRRKLKPAFLLALSSYGLATIVNSIIRGIFYIDRPYITLHKIPLVLFPPRDSSFPSGHAISVFLLATVIFSYNKKWGIFFYILAILVGVGRVLALVHYPFDIIAGAVIGIASVVIIRRLYPNFR